MAKLQNIVLAVLGLLVCCVQFGNNNYIWDIKLSEICSLKT